MAAMQNQTLESQDSIAENIFKIVVIGDGAVGKTAFCEVYAKGKFPEGYSPTVFDSYPREMKNGNEVRFLKKILVPEMSMYPMFKAKRSRRSMDLKNGDILWGRRTK